MRLRDRGNHAAWSEFLQIYEPVIYRLARRRQLQDADAREIVQEVLLRVAAAIDRFDPDGTGSFRGWLSQTTRRVAVDRFRRLSDTARPLGGETNVLADVVDGIEIPLETEFDLEHRRQLFQCAAEHVRPMVSATTWDAFWQTAVGDHPARAVAQDLGLSEGAVYVARCRVLKRLREFIEQREAE
ncbi:ECF RNA polymerase sigma factor SigE [Stieleria neptunia]|uniref:ECF RNA polymerase sigma factor SigE n=1 Tax=Stieleria neptunia TaxID=2527979 RepID=A0A518HJH3_9BACT|nr:ECF RNA polymerase sigma factor SigE [Stieleria neptunia]